MQILHANPNFDAQLFHETCNGIASSFVESTAPITSYVPEGIIHSDGLCICALCEMYQVDYLIEIGRANGGSTEMFARYFADHPQLKHIWSVDLKVGRIFLFLGRRFGPSNVWKHIHPTDRDQDRRVAQRLAPFRHIVSLVNGDAFKKVPKLLRRIGVGAHRVGFFIDGPKEEPQMRLANQLLAMSPNIPFVALDDVGPRYIGRFDRLCENPLSVFCTADDEFYRRYGWVNKGRVPLHLPERGSAFSGIGVLINSPAATFK